jgi:hypothetical protein
LDERDAEGDRLPGPRLRLAEDVAAADGVRDHKGLDLEGRLDASLLQALDDGIVDAQIREGWACHGHYLKSVQPNSDVVGTQT